jgi:hypothetical protein
VCCALCFTDYAEVITEIRTSVPGAAHSPVIGFGGSYGGMLATWMRLKVSNSPTHANPRRKVVVLAYPTSAFLLSVVGGKGWHTAP